MHLCDGVDVSRETMDNLERFRALLEKWTSKINLIAPDTVSQIWDRHIIDSAQIFPMIPSNAKHYVDLGSGGGLPAIVLAILGKESRPAMVSTLIESDLRKATFLRTCIRELGLSATVIADRINRAEAQACDVITARALAALPTLLDHITYHLDQNGVALLPKGRNYASEMDDARTDWSFSSKIHVSLTDPSARILELRNIARVTP